MWDVAAVGEDSGRCVGKQRFDVFGESDGDQAIALAPYEQRFRTELFEPSPKAVRAERTLEINLARGCEERNTAARCAEDAQKFVDGGFVPRVVQPLGLRKEQP